MEKIEKVYRVLYNNFCMESRWWQQLWLYDSKTLETGCVREKLSCEDSVCPILILGVRACLFSFPLQFGTFKSKPHQFLCKYSLLFPWQTIIMGNTEKTNAKFTRNDEKSICGERRWQKGRIEFTFVIGTTRNTFVQVYNQIGDLYTRRPGFAPS